jgi:hypothetical protein
MKPRAPGGTRGSALAISLFIMAVFSLLAVALVASSKSMGRAVVDNLRQAQAQAIAEAGLEDAMTALHADDSWRAGFTKKPFAGGYYTVTLTTGIPPLITSTGYSAPIVLLGSAVRSVAASAQMFDDNCAYAIAANNAVSINGTIDAYDPAVSLTPPATGFVSGGNVGSNSGISASGPCPPALIRGDTYAVGSNPAACYVAGTENTLAGPLVIPSHPCPDCAAVNDNLTGISPLSAYHNYQLTVDNQTVTLQPGKYYLKKITIKNNGILNALASPSQRITIYMDGNFVETSPCQFNNVSKVPSSLRIYDVATAGHQVRYNCTTPLHAYIEGTWAQQDIFQELYGHFCSDRVTVEAGAAVHYDLRGGSVSHVSWVAGPSGSWGQSYKRQ